MEGLEIVITPRIIERMVYGAVIIILLSLAIFNMGGEQCLVPEDSLPTGLVLAQPNVTENKTHAAATLTSSDACTNGIKDADETDIDCGPTCGGCSEFQGCNLDSDCGEGLYCFQHLKCMAPSCEDGLKNQDETNIDCGGICEGYWWASDKSCHTTQEPSGRLEVDVEVNFLESELSKNVMLDEVTIEISNGLSRNLALEADIYALDRRGEHVFEDRDGKPIPVETLVLDSLESGESLSETAALGESTRKTLPGIKADDPFQIAVELRDGDGDIIERKVWTNEPG